MIMPKKCKVLALMLVGIFLVTFIAGCGGNGAKDDKSASKTITTSAADKSNDSEKKEADSTNSTKPTDPFDYSTVNIDWNQKQGTSIRVLLSKHFFTDGVQKLLPDFEKLTGIKVQLEVFPESEFWNKMLIEFNGGSNPPDAFMLNYNTVAQYSTGGWLEPLDQYIKNPKLTDDKWYDFNDFLPKALDFGTFQDVFYGLPVTGEWQILFYRKDLYEQKGLKVPETFDDLYANCKVLNGDKMAGIVNRCARTSAAFWPWGGFVRTYGGYWFTPENEPQLESDPVVKATDMYTKLLKDFGPKGVVNYTWYEALTDFQQGKAAHFIDSSGFMAMVEDPAKSVVAGKVGYAPLPSAEKGKKAVPNVNHWMLGMGKQSKNKDAAYLFLEWATSKKIGLDIAINNGTAARTSLWKNEDFLKKYPKEWAQASLDSAAIADKLAIPQIKELGQVGEYLEIALNEICYDKPVKDALKEAQAKTLKAIGK